jgi:hypothetical protein
MVELNELQGLWRRTLIAWPGDRFDTTTEVYWLQGPSRYADLRIPAGRPKLEAAACLRDLDWPMLRFMTLQEGFIGHLELSHSLAHWHRIFDYQPASGVADKGRLEFADDILVEHGVEASYVEHWRREAGTAQDVVALWLYPLATKSNQNAFNGRLGGVETSARISSNLLAPCFACVPPGAWPRDRSNFTEISRGD